MKTILKQKFVLLAFCLLTIGSQSCSNETATTQEVEEVYGTEELLAEVGVLNLYVGDESVAEEKYIVLWKKEDGKWKLFRNIFNSNLPAE